MLKSSLSGTLTWKSTKDMHIEVAFDRIALAGSNLAMLSAVGFVQDIKAIRAGLGAQLRIPMKIEGVTLHEGKERSYADNACNCASQGYTVVTHKLGYDTLHALFLSKTPGFLPNESDDCLWSELMLERFQTPLLRQWVPYLRQELIDHPKQLLRPCSCYGANCWGLIATTADLDLIVQAGLTMGEIRIEDIAA